MSTTGNIESGTNVVQFVGGQVARYYGGPIGQAAASYLLGQPGLTGSILDLTSKLDNGTATSYDVADVLQDVASVLAGVGVLAGLANPWVLTAVGVAGLVNFIAQNHDAILDFALDPLPTRSSTVPIIIDPQSAVHAGLLDPKTLLPKAVSSSIGSTPDPLVKTIRYVDPLMIDLDGDGLEVAPLAIGVLFDSNGDGIKTGTAWIGADDGFLTWDRNGNGSIDSGRELFGDETILANGQLAPHGFAALRELDQGSVVVGGMSVGAGDGIFDAKDAQYANLRVWRDLNQDGISQADELKTLTEAGVQAINLNSTAVSINYGDAILVQDGLFARADGSTGQAGSFILAQNSFVREFTPVELSAEAAALPNLGGSGWVRDLQEAAMLDPQLIGKLHAVRDAGTRDDYRAAVGELLQAWGSDSAYQSAAKEALEAGYVLIFSAPQDAQETSWLDIAVKAGDQDREAFRAALSPQDRTKFDAMRERMVAPLERMAAYEAFTGHTFVSWSRVFKDAFDWTPPPTTRGRVPVEVWVSLTELLEQERIAQPWGAGYVLVQIPAPLAGEAHVTTLWNRLVDDVSANLYSTLRLGKFLDAVEIVIDESSVRLDFSAVIANLEAKATSNAYDVIGDLIDLQRYCGEQLRDLGWPVHETLASVITTTPLTSEMQALLGASRVALLDAGTANFTPSDLSGWIVLGNAASNNIRGTVAVDTISGEAGADYLYGRDGNDILNGGADDDYLYGENGADTLDGGSGNDGLYGGAGNDTYLFGRGDGQDTIGSDHDTAAGKLNVLQFKADVAPSEIVATRSGSSLVLSVAGTTDKVTIRDFFYGDDPSNAYNAIQRVKFADGTNWDVTALKNKVFAGTAGADNISGTVAADTISGEAGADYLYGRDGNDTLNGGADNDYLYGENGADTLDGGSGNDYLSGGAGNDTYLFGKSDGQDTIGSDHDTAAGKLNVLQFKAGVAPSEIVATRSGSDLVLSIAGTTDRVTIGYFFYGDDPSNAYNAIQRVKFADGTNWDVTALKNKVFAGTAGADNISGTVAADVIDGQAGADSLQGRDGNDTLNGGADNDYLYGENGADTLDGGSGNDYLSGGAGNDTYLFGKGDGQDTIESDHDTAAGKLNVLQFKAGVAPSEIVATRSGSDLVLSIAGTTDRVTIGYFFYGDDPSNAYNAIQRVKFADGTSWDVAALKNKVFAGTAGADHISGTVAADVINGQAGADYLYGRDGNDTLNGGADNDYLYGENGADALDGGSGNDYLSGGAGNDTYLFGKGDGQDTIGSDHDTAAGKLNVLQFKAGVVPSEIVATRSGSDLVLSIAGTTDRVTIGYFFYGDDPSNAYNAVQRVKFADGTSWDVAALKNKAFAGTPEADSISGTRAADVISGQGGADYLYGQAGDDTLDGGGGNDGLYGGAGNDTYLFGKGDGQDTIGSDYDTAATKLNVLLFKAGVASSEIVATRSGSSLVLSIAGTADKVTVADFFYADDTANAYNAIQQVKFADGTSWDVAALKNKAFAGTPEADSISGTRAADVISGQGGADYLYGQAGDDTLDGGGGNDGLYGGAGNDTYLFGKGDGQDTIGSDYDTAASKLNVLQFKAGVASSEIVATRSGSSLVLSIVGTADKVTVSDFFHTDDPANAYNAIQQVKFADGTSWDVTALKNKAFAGTEGSDSISGTHAADVISGQAGADYLYGQAGSDTLDGGSGNDYLSGGAGNDTYLFGRGSGADTVSDYDSTAGNIDLLSIGSGVATDQLWFRRVGSDLEMSIIGTGDKTTIGNWYSGSAYHVEQFKTSDGKMLLDSRVDALVSAMAAFAPPAAGQTALPANYQTALNPLIAANWQ